MEIVIDAFGFYVIGAFLLSATWYFLGQHMNYKKRVKSIRLKNRLCYFEGIYDETIKGYLRLLGVTKALIVMCLSVGALMWYQSYLIHFGV